ncbi:MAG: 16S rRNA (uracil(1498)-N(3))-methyltransferase [Anaerolineae bacterium]|jgi:16S rRNA (uracil1498-N3)-methyltransferase
MTQRFFVPSRSIADDVVIFGPDATHQLRVVLRLHSGAQVIVLDGSGMEYDVTIERMGRDTATGHIVSRHAAETEPRVKVTLYQSLLKGDRFEWVLQKGTELGVSQFVPVFAERTVVRGAAWVEKRRDRLERIIREAAEQSCRGRLPDLGSALSFEEACVDSAAAHDLSILPAVAAGGGGLATALQARSQIERVALLVGPEGGFAPEEIALAEGHGLHVVTLGPRILRAETAGIVAPALVLYALGEMQ